MTSSALKLATERAGEALLRRGWLVATSESCTGGAMAHQLTEIGGSSAWFERGFVTYSNIAKIELLGVSPDILAEYGAVSRETALAMVQGTLERSRADVAIAVTGIAGPSGGSPGKPVGTIWFGFAVRGEAPQIELQQFDGDRQAVREAATVYALSRLAELAEEPPSHLA